MEKMDPFITFDWYFADASAEDSARVQALNARPSETRVLLDIVRADSVVNFALWSELPDGHPVRELWLESQTDLLATVYLAYGGFFRQALAVVRSWFEITTHEVFFSGHYGQPTGRYEKWRAGERNAPTNMEVLAESLAARTDKVLAVDKAAILIKLNGLYGFLSQQTHAQGLDVCNLQDGRDNVMRYLAGSFEIWYTKLLEAFGAICFLYRVFFPRQLGGYLGRSKGELETVVALEGTLKGSVPEFAELVRDSLAFLPE
jgi:hypothetical protein